jgi:hypothetical protein
VLVLRNSLRRARSLARTLVQRYSETVGIQLLGTVDMAPKNLEGPECSWQGLNFGFAQESRTPVCRLGGLSGRGREKKRMNVRLEVEEKSCSNL